MAADQGEGFERYHRPINRDAFLARMDEIVPWKALCRPAPHEPYQSEVKCEVTELYYPRVGNGRPPVGLERMLRMCFVQHLKGTAGPPL